MPLRPLSRPSSEPLALHDRAMEDLRFIRRTMERAGAFTAVPGWGGVAMGATAVVAAPLAAGQPDVFRWMGVWFAAAALAIAIGTGSIIHKARRFGIPVLSGSGRSFLLGFLPPILAGAVVTGALLRVGADALLPGSWLLLYGLAVVGGGAHSVRAVPVMGMAFLALGTAALLTAPGWADGWMALGFGGLHLAFGLFIARRHGG